MEISISINTILITVYCLGYLITLPFLAKSLQIGHKLDCQDVGMAMATSLVWFLILPLKIITFILNKVLGNK